MRQSSGQCEARNILASPGYKNFDFSLYKNTRIAERVDTQFRAEFFNVLNHPNFQGPFDTNTIDQPGARCYTRLGMPATFNLRLKSFSRARSKKESGCPTSLDN